MQYVAYSLQQFPNEPLVQQVPHYQSQHSHVYSPVIRGTAIMMAPPTHAQPGLVSSSTTQYGAHEQTHVMYVLWVSLLSSMHTLRLPHTHILHTLSLQLPPLDSSKANMVEVILYPVLFSTISTRLPRLSIWPVHSSSHQPFTMQGLHQPHLP
ncbi:hypothetical protein P7K49_016737 [Saguinus oedipus]|uniref:Uncharacterized protein n=1 Tax=Saguinus oedipus TaxID=9490 RepID=A0ABQ9VCY9_SAGOE|nr:hypothetical protein P7K49_016737 [Saguinus oedipus]